MDLKHTPIPHYKTIQVISAVIVVSLLKHQRAVSESKEIPYSNRGKKSGIKSYSIETDNKKSPVAISVTFMSGMTYSYTSRQVGQQNLLAMIRLAKTGAGLNSYINNKIKTKKKYA